MKVVFFGNTKYSIIVLDALYKEFGLSTIVTLPPRLLVRKKVPTPNPVHTFAIQHKISVILVEKWSKEILKQVQDDTLLRADFFVVDDYGIILPKEVLALPKIAPLNVHHSLLPKYRGPSPAPFAILNGDATTGITVITMSQKMDAGPILAQKEYQLKPAETTDSLLTELNILGAEILIPVIKNYDSIKQKHQDESKTSYSKLFTKNDGYIDIENPPSPEQVDRMIRAHDPWPGVWTKLKINNEELRIKFLPGQKLQIEGKKPMSYKDFINGYKEGKSLLDKLNIKV